MPSATTGSLSLYTPQSVDRWLAGIFPESTRVTGEPPIERSNAEPPRIGRAIPLEDGDDLRVHAIDAPPVVAFAAFLDGRQGNETKCYRPGGVPIVLGSVGAVIRERRDRRLSTWSHRVERALYVSRPHLGERDWHALRAGPYPVRDTSMDDEEPPGHPLALREAAFDRIQHDRERVEQSLAKEWCAKESRPLLIDGGISGTEVVARSRLAIGVVKSHRTLYAGGESIKVLLGMKARERSSAFVIASEKRERVASWYLRMHDPQGHDPLWGLVRVEAAAPLGRNDDDIGARADEVSRWILAEAQPVALPDNRWDKMVYGVRDCEEFLRAVM